MGDAQCSYRRRIERGDAVTMSQTRICHDPHRNSLYAIGWRENTYVATRAERIQEFEALVSHAKCRRTSATTQSTT